MRLKLLPCAPCDLERVEEWINDEQKDGWRLKRFGILLPFLAFFVRDSAGGEYTISLEPRTMTGLSASASCGTWAM